MQVCIGKVAQQIPGACRPTFAGSVRVLVEARASGQVTLVCAGLVNGVTDVAAADRAAVIKTETQERENISVSNCIDYLNNCLNVCKIRAIDNMSTFSSMKSKGF